MKNTSLNNLMFYNIILLFILILLIRLNLLWPPQYLNSPLVKNDEHLFSIKQSFNKTLEDAFNSIKYLYLMQRNEAQVLSVIERRKTVIEALCYCGYCSPKLIFHKIQNNMQMQKIKWIQSINDGSEFFYLFSAHVDRRKNSLYPTTKVSVQVLASAFNYVLENQTYSHYCHFATHSSKIDFSVKAHIRMIWQRGWDPRNTFYNAYLITCPVPEQYTSEFIKRNEYCNFVTVSFKKCPAFDKINFLEINGRLEAVHLMQSITDINKFSLTNKSSSLVKIGVCVKGMDFLKGEIYYKKLLEWLEIQYALGASSITIYTYYVPPNIYDIFRIYVEQNRLKVIEIELPGNSPNQIFFRHEYIWRNRQQKRRHELIPYNDCFYRYIYSQDFVLIVDVDEIIVPLKHLNWVQMLFEIIKQQQQKTPKYQLSTLSIQNVFTFFGMELPGSIFDQRNRSAFIQERGLYGKSFINTQSIATVFNHFALHRLHNNVLRTIYVNENTALKLHFKSNCPAEIINDCKKFRGNSLKDTSLDSIKEIVLKNSKIVLQKLSKTN